MGAAPPHVVAASAVSSACGAAQGGGPQPGMPKQLPVREPHLPSIRRFPLVVVVVDDQRHCLARPRPRLRPRAKWDRHPSRRPARSTHHVLCVEVLAPPLPPDVVDVLARLLRAATLACACSLVAACEPGAVIHEAAFALHTATGCELGTIEQLDLVALGDFPSRRERLDPRTPTATFDKFPLGTLELAIEVRFASAESAGGRAAVVAAGSGMGNPSNPRPNSIVVLPEGRSCPLSDLGIVAGEGAVVAALPRGGMLIAGGTSNDGKVLSSAATVAAGELIGAPVPDGMLQPRRFATATVAGAWVIVAGGVDAHSGADATFEVFDPARGRFAGELSRKLSNARMEHGAALLPDGNVLLAGGRSEPGGSPLPTAELIRLEPPAPEQPGDLVDARVEPSVLVLDSGAVIVAGGRDEGGAVVPSLERLEAAPKRFVRLKLDLPSYENVVAVALPGARVAWLGCDTGSQACGLTLVLLRGDEPVRVDVALDWQSSVPLGLSRLRVAALDDGRLLVTGRDPDANMMSRAFVIDLAARTIDSLEASRAPTVLAPLADGAIAELDAFGTSLRRLGSFSMYDSPEGDVLEASARRVALDAPDRWKRERDGMRALVLGARVDLPHLQFGRFRLELRLSGEALVRIATTDAPDLAIGVGARVSAPGCPQLSAAGRLVLERRIDGVAIKLAANARDTCVVPLPGLSPARLAIEAETDTVLHDLRVTRL